MKKIWRRYEEDMKKIWRRDAKEMKKIWRRDEEEMKKRRRTDEKGTKKIWRRDEEETKKRWGRYEEDMKKRRRTDKEMENRWRTDDAKTKKRWRDEKDMKKIRRRDEEMKNRWRDDEEMKNRRRTDEEMRKVWRRDEEETKNRWRTDEEQMTQRRSFWNQRITQSNRTFDPWIIQISFKKPAKEWCIPYLNRDFIRACFSRFGLWSSQPTIKDKSLIFPNHIEMCFLLLNRIKFASWAVICPLAECLIGFLKTDSRNTNRASLVGTVSQSQQVHSKDSTRNLPVWYDIFIYTRYITVPTSRNIYDDSGLFPFTIMDIKTTNIYVQ